MQSYLKITITIHKLGSKIQTVSQSLSNLSKCETTIIFTFFAIKLLYTVSALKCYTNCICFATKPKLQSQGKVVYCTKNVEILTKQCKRAKTQAPMMQCKIAELHLLDKTGTWKKVLRQKPCVLCSLSWSGRQKPSCDFMRSYVTSWEEVTISSVQTKVKVAECCAHVSFYCA